MWRSLARWNKEVTTSHTSHISSLCLAVDLPWRNPATVYQKCKSPGRYQGLFGWIQVCHYSPAINIHPSFWKTLTIASHSILINPCQMICSQPVTPEWSAGLHHWASASFLIPSAAQYRDRPLCLPLHLSLTPLSSDIPSLSFLAAEFCAAVQLYYPVRVPSALQSITRPVLQTFPHLKSEWHVSHHLTVVHRNPTQ